MDKTIADKKISVVGIDLSKRHFSVCGMDEKGNVVHRKSYDREGLIEFMVCIKPCLVGMEACGGAHHFARMFSNLGHKVRLIAPQFVKPFVKSNKNDSLDAEAICEAVQRPNMRFVPIKSVEQQDLQSLHRMRSMVIAHRTALINQIRGFLTEYGVTLPVGANHVRGKLLQILEDMANELTSEMRRFLGQLREELVRLDERISGYDREIKAVCDRTEACKMLLTIPGVGFLIATALIAAIGDISVFKNGREMAAYLGLVPMQNSTGGKDRLLGISKRGDVYLRMLLIHGARSALRVAGKKDDRRSRWAVGLEERRGTNVAAVALANKNVRVAWAILSKNEKYKPLKAA
ncbi:MAG: IS110 family transposase [Magnetococcus sp. YQC-3]